MAYSKNVFRICIFTGILALVRGSGDASIQFTGTLGLTGKETFTGLTPLVEGVNGEFAWIFTAGHSDSTEQLILKIVNDQKNSAKLLLNEWNILLKLGAIVNLRDLPSEIAGARKAGIPYVYGYGEILDGPYKGKKVIVMEKLGQTLYDYVIELMKNGKEVPLNTWTYLAYDITRSLEYIHSRNVIHRDLKPENLLVDPRSTRGGGAMEWCLIDYGLSHDLDVSLPTLFDRAGSEPYLSQHMLMLPGNETELPQNQEDDLESSTIILAIVKWKGMPWFVEGTMETQKGVIDALPAKYQEFSKSGFTESAIKIIQDTLAYTRESAHTTGIKDKEQELVSRWKQEISKQADEERSISN